MTGNKFKHILASALLILPLALQVFAGASTVKAANNGTTAIEITKLAFDTDPGDAIPDTVKDYHSGDALTKDQLNTLHAKTQSGVEFTIYDATEAYKNADGKDAAAKMKALSDDVETGKITGLSVANDTAGKDAISTTDANGKITGLNVAKDADGKYAVGTTDANGNIDMTLKNRTADDKQYAVYVIKETNASGSAVQDEDGNAGDTSITHKAAPIVLVMPLAAAGDDKGVVHIYPKNVYGETLAKDIDASAKVDNRLNGNKAVATAVGDQVPFDVTVTVPEDIKDTTAAFGFTDTPDAGLVDDVASIKITKDGTPVDAKDVLLDTDGIKQVGDGFTLSFDPAKLAPYAGAKLIVKYKATLTKDLTPDEPLSNTVTTLGNHPKPFKSQTPVTTGGYKFVKTSAADGSPLKGAQFIIAKKYSGGTELYGVKNADKPGYSWTDNEADATPVTSDAQGNFSFTGLAYSLALQDKTGTEYDQIKTKTKTGTGDDTKTETFDTYETIETVAPDGYALLTEHTPFVVGAGSYKADPTEIKDAPKGKLPSTGGMGIYIVIAVGLAIALAGVAFLRRGKHHEEV